MRPGPCLALGAARGALCAGLLRRAAGGRAPPPQFYSSAMELAARAVPPPPPARARARAQAPCKRRGEGRVATIGNRCNGRCARCESLVRAKRWRGASRFTSVTSLPSPAFEPLRPLRRAAFWASGPRTRASAR